MRSIIVIVLVVLFGFGSLADRAAFAHRVHVFADWVDGILEGEGYYSRGNPARDAIVSAYCVETGLGLAETRTDAKGRFTFRLDPEKPIRLVMNAGQGHQAQYIVSSQFSEQEDAQQSLESTTKVAERDNAINAEAAKMNSSPNFRSIGLGFILISGIFGGLYFFKKPASGRKNHDR